MNFPLKGNRYFFPLLLLYYAWREENKKNNLQLYFIEIIKENGLMIYLNFIIIVLIIIMAFM